MANQLITFRVGNQDLGVDILAVQGIKTWSPVTPLPHVPSFVRGVLNLRGAVLPVIDLSDRLGWGASEAGDRHVVIFVTVGAQQVGMIADAVLDIVTVEESLRPAPETTAEAEKMIEGLLPVHGRMVMVLSLEQLLAGETLDIRQAA